MPLRFAQAPSAVQASTSAILFSQSVPPQRVPFTWSALTFPFLLTQQMFALEPQVLFASHCSTGFLHCAGSVASCTAPFTTFLAHCTYFLCELVPEQSQAAEITARMLSIAVRSVQRALLHCALATLCVARMRPAMSASLVRTII